MSARTLENYLPLLLPVTVFSVYLCTTAPIVYVGDSGEFTAAAFSLGIPHNSGYPLYSLVGKIFCMIPFGNVGFRMNLMSAFFAALTVFLIYDIVRKFTRNTLCSLTAAGFLAFTPLFWSQTVSAEVYPLHVFFLALMIRLLWQWDQSKDFHRLLMFVFVTGLSFGNHMQTVMMAPPVLYFIISGDKNAIFSLRNFAAISVFFMLPLSLYLYLPIRTQAGAAIHWGDPDNVERFLAHVTATAHRGTYVFSASPSQYLSRFVDTLKIIGLQYGILMLLSLWGWMKLSSLRWKIFFAGIILFDLFYTAFLNIISLEITPFTLPSTIVMAILLGVGLNHLLDWIRRREKIGPSIRKGVVTAFCIIPIITLLANFGICDQSDNYTAYEHTANIFRTVDYGSTIFLDGDNNVFPVVYGRIVEGMGDGIILHDKHNLLFKWRLPSYPFVFSGSWDELTTAVQREIIRYRSDQGVYFATIDPFAISLPKGYRSVPCGILRKAVLEASEPDLPEEIWDYYATTSHTDDFFRDFMNRKVTSYHFFRRGEHLWDSGRVNESMNFLKLASRVGYNDTSIHSDLGIFFTDRGLFEEARKALERALLYHDDPGGVYNNWGYYHHKRGDYQSAIASFEKALKFSPDNFAFYNNLGFTFASIGQKEDAREVFKKSLLLKSDQPELVKFIQRHEIEKGVP